VDRQQQKTSDGIWYCDSRRHPGCASELDQNGATADVGRCSSLTTIHDSRLEMLSHHLLTFSRDRMRCAERGSEEMASALGRCDRSASVNLSPARYSDSTAAARRC
jgi:hypothetical protein